MRYPRMIPLALLAGCIAVAASAPLAVSITEPETELPDVAAPKINDPISEAELQDLQAIADQHGMSLEAAIDRYAWNDNLALALTEIQETAPSAFTMAEIVDAENAWVAFAGDAPANALDLIAEFSDAHPEVSIDIQPNWGYSAVELERAIEAVHFAVLESPGVSDAATTFDSATSEITTTVVLEAVGAAVDLGELAQESLTTSVGEALSSQITTNVVVSAHPVLGGDDSSAYHYGGEAIAGCTTGFGVRAWNNTRGIATAGHCDNPQTDDGAALTYQAGHEGTHGDFQWHTGARAESDDFYTGSATATEVNRRDVSTVLAPYVGQPLCKNGRSGFQDCQDVRKINVCDGGHCNLVQMNARLAAGGDSGGPVYYGYVAYGFHEGYMYDPVWPADRDLFSRADRIDNALSISIATS